MFNVDQLNAYRKSEFGVGPKHFGSKGNFVNNALPWAVAAVEQFKIVHRVVLSVAVLVMHCFFGKKLTAKMLGHDVAMFKYGMLFSSNKRRDRNPNVTVSLYVSFYISAIKAIQCFSALAIGFAFTITKLLFVVKVPIWAAFKWLCFTALFACKCVATIGSFSASYVRACARTVHRVFAEFFVVRGYVRLHHNKRLLTFVAGEIYRSNSCSGSAVGSFVGAVAHSSAKLSGSILRLNAKRRLTVFADFINRHSYSPFGLATEKSVAGMLS